MSKYLNNPEIEAQVSSVDGQVAGAQEVTGTVHKAAHTISDCTRWKGNGADSIKGYINNGAVNVAGGVMELISMLNQVGQTLKADWLGYESDASGKVEQETVENLKEDQQNQQTSWNGFVPSMEATKSRGEAHTSMSDLQTSGVDDAFTKLLEKMDEVLEELVSTDASAVTDPEQLLADINAVQSQITSTMNYLYQGGNIPDYGTMMSRVEDLKNQDFYSKLPNHSMWVHLMNNPYFPVDGIHKTEFTEWNMGVDDGILRTFKGYRAENTKWTGDPLLAIKKTEKGWTIIDHKGKDQEWHLSIGSGEYAIIEMPDGSRQKIHDTKGLNFYTRPTDPKAESQFSFSTELFGFKNNQFASKDGGYVQGSFGFEVASADLDAKTKIFGADWETKASGKAGYVNADYRIGVTDKNENGKNFAGWDLSLEGGAATAKGSTSLSKGDWGVALSGDVDFYNASVDYAAYQEGDTTKFGLTGEVNTKRARVQAGVQYKDNYVMMNNGLFKNTGLDDPSSIGPSNEFKPLDKGNSNFGGMFTINTVRDDAGNVTGHDIITDVKSSTMKDFGGVEKEKSIYHIPSF